MGGGRALGHILMCPSLQTCRSPWGATPPATNERGELERHNQMSRFATRYSPRTAGLWRVVFALLAAGDV